MKTFAFIAATVVLFVAILFSPDAQANTSLRVAPLEYRATIAKGEKKKGYVDVSNPTNQKVIVSTSVQAFRQIDDKGTLQFFDDEQVAAGVLLDLDEFELGPREAVRMYFLLDSTKLPPGDVFASVFFTTKPAKSGAGVGQAVRLGTVLSLVNGTPGARSAAITNLDVPLFQFGGTVSGSYAIKNTADPTRATGFYPQVKVWASPLGESKEVAGSLVFAGRTRTNDFSLKLPPIGIYRVSASYGNSSAANWVVVLHPAAIVAGLLLLLLLVSVRAVKRRQRRASFKLK